MTRYVFPDAGLARRLDAARYGGLDGQPVKVWTDPSGTAAADIRSYPVGVAIATAVVMSGADGPGLFYGPDGVTQLYASINGGPVVPVYRSELPASLLAELQEAAERRVVTVDPPSGVAATDVAAIRAAIVALAPAGGLVQLRAGTYAVSAPALPQDGGVLVDVNNVRVAGMGIGVTTLRVADGTAADITGVIRTKSGVENTHITISDMTIDGNRDNLVGDPEPRIIGVYCGTTPNTLLEDTDITIERVEVKGCTDYGIDPHELTKRLRIIDCVTHDNTGDGCTVDGCQDVLISGLTTHDNGRHGLNLVTGSKHIRVTGLASYNNAENGVTIQNGAKDVSFDGSCRIRGNGKAGVYINGMPQVSPRLDLLPTTGVLMTGVSVDGSGENSVFIEGSAGNKFFACEFVDASMDAANTSSHVLLKPASGNNATDNAFIGCTWRNRSGSAKYGIDEFDASQGPTRVMGCGGSGIGTAPYRLQHPTSLLLLAHAESTGEHPTRFAHADTPADHSLLEWNYPPSAQGSSSGVALVAGTVYGMRLNTASGKPIGKVTVGVGAAGSGLVSGQCQLVVVNAAGAVLARNDDISTLFGATGPVDVTVPTFTPAAGSVACVLLLFNGTTPPSLICASSSSVTARNAGQGATSPRNFFTAGTALAAIPAGIAMGSTTATGALSLWCAMGAPA